MPALPTKAAEQDIFAVAERLQDLAWTLRERQIETATCVQIEELAATILSAFALRDPADRRAQRLGQALGYLEQRLEAMLAGSVAAVNVPSRVNVPIWISMMMRSSMRGALDRHWNASGSTTSDSPCAPSGCDRDAGSG